MLIRALLAALALVAAPLTASAVDLEANERGQIEFSMPSANIGCIYTPEGGTPNYKPAGGGPELLCDRIAPTYIRIILGPSGAAKKLTNVGDASCCGAIQTVPYGQSWEYDGFLCTSSKKGLACERDGHGFFLSKAKVKVY